MTVRAPRSPLPTLAVCVLFAMLAGCSTAAPLPAASSATPTATASPSVFAAGAVADYQLGGAYEPDAAVSVVVRDASEEPLAGAYSICYLNGFQSQPGESWPSELLLRDAAGDPVIDANWPDETLLDIRTAGNRDAIAARFAPLIEGCVSAGFAAVEFDNLDSYARSAGVLEREQAVAMAMLFVQLGHSSGLAVAQKNSAELLGEAASAIGFDFAIVEECDQYSECGDFTDFYGEAVIDIEYTDELRRPFSEVCADAATPRITMLRDRDLTPPGSAEYVFEHC
ncbi:endo alpha-1,4 polygalactosaminidase [Salinibacterium sp. SWN1162]|uniref:endo alpha-1,4 polygalactosaminidase n=1 Tax=Salinibacterium sp. SWN1162 TaxID=2792053 RepID=UPI0018CE1D84|nr:endo alpha-1,4 polygalactosaminidase [Salinibacterium sp. SWN1162]MBH0007799.1 endo alpha-1,4 polygalactosaminidase [Salinibacterium sp. SWN1162]